MSQTCHKTIENAKNESRKLCLRLSFFKAIPNNFRKAPQLLLCGIVLRMIRIAYNQVRKIKQKCLNYRSNHRITAKRKGLPPVIHRQQALSVA